jgi:hypothetical protein
VRKILAKAASVLLAAGASDGPRIDVRKDGTLTTFISESNPNAFGLWHRVHF